MTAPDPKPAPRKGNRPRRIIDPKAIRRAKLQHPECMACGRRGGDGHHILPKDRGGDDVEANIGVLCGSGTSGCHGAHHGSPYVVAGERRDARWVNHRIGNHLIEGRPDSIAYAVGKLGKVRASAVLEGLYAIRLDDDGVWRLGPAQAPMVTTRR